MATSISYDEEVLQHLVAGGEERERIVNDLKDSMNVLDSIQIDGWRAECAVKYRLTRKLIVSQLINKLQLISDILVKIRDSDRRIETEHVSNSVRSEFREAIYKLILTLAEEKLENEVVGGNLRDAFEIAKRKYEAAPKELSGMYIGVSIFEELLDYFEARYISIDILGLA